MNADKLIKCVDCDGTGVAPKRKRKHPDSPCLRCGGHGKLLTEDPGCPCRCHGGGRSVFGCCFVPCCKLSSIRVADASSGLQHLTVEKEKEVPKPKFAKLGIMEAEDERWFADIKKLIGVNDE